MYSGHWVFGNGWLFKSSSTQKCSIDDKVNPIFNVEIKIKKSMKTILWIYGDDNDVFAIQDTDGAKDLDIRIYNDDNTVDTRQTGYAEHAANITLNGSQPTTLNLIQQGNTARTYTLSQNCVTAGGCTITVTQD